MNHQTVLLCVLVFIIFVFVIVIPYLLSLIPYEPGYETLEDQLRKEYDDHKIMMVLQGVKPLEYEAWKRKVAEMEEEIRDD